MTTKTLSDKRISKYGSIGYYFKEQDVREFIKKLKEAGDENDWDIMLENDDGEDITISFNEWIDELAGEKLTGDEK